MWPYSSLQYYRGDKRVPKWLDISDVMSLFNDDRKQYLEFVSEYQDSMRELAVLKWQLANNPDDD